MTFGQAITSGLRNYVTFSGRTPRSGYWYWVLFTVIVTLAASIIDAALFTNTDLSPINSLVSLALFLPSLCHWISPAARHRPHGSLVDAAGFHRHRLSAFALLGLRERHNWAEPLR